MTITQGKDKHYVVLDGWRGISILAVLACHFLPLGPAKWGMNAVAGGFGMAVFFSLSGFLITTFLLRHASVGDFLIRRICRILPLAWLALPIGLSMSHASANMYLPNFLFFANYPPFWLPPVTAHFWSLCVEVQFYLAIALVFGMCGKRGLLLLLPLGCVVITGIRVYMHAHQSIVTYLRVDEILAGSVMALIYAGDFGPRAKSMLGALNPFLLLVLLCASAHEAAGPLDYLRPYLAASLVGATLLGAGKTMRPVLASKQLAYVAEISYALYIIHPLMADTWLSSGTKLIRYAKRPLLFAAVFAAAHASTFWYEHRWIALGKRLSASLIPRRAAEVV